MCLNTAVDGELLMTAELDLLNSKHSTAVVTGLEPSIWGFAALSLTHSAIWPLVTPFC